MEPQGDPSDFEDWSVWRNFHEAGRLMTTHLHVFLPTFVTHLIPGSLILVVFFQFLTESFSPGSSVFVVFYVVPPNLVALAFPRILHEIKDSVYALDAARYRKGESLKDLLSGGDCYDGRRRMAVAVAIVCTLVYALTVVPVHAFGFEGVAAVGMPKWTAVLVTPLLAVGMSLVHLYLILLVNLVWRLWLCAA